MSGGRSGSAARAAGAGAEVRGDESRGLLLARIVSGLALAALVVGLCWAASSAYRLLTDAWAAPIQLSPDSDRVVKLRIRHSRRKSELARVEAEVARMDASLEAVERSLERLSATRGSVREAMSWDAEVHREQKQALDRQVDNLESQRELLSRLHERQERLTQKAREDLKARLIDRTALEAEEQALDKIEVSMAENRRKLEEATMRRRQLALATAALAENLGESARAPARAPRGRMPEVVDRERRALQVELEIARLEGERAGLRAMRETALARLEQERALLEEVEARPLYRALDRSTNLVFVPYSELEGVGRGSSVHACVWAVLFCERVGAIAEVVPGEVVTQDPWGELARGRYAVLDLEDPDAIKERVLRIRP